MKTHRALTPWLLLAVAGVALAACVPLSRGPVGNAAVPQPAKAVDLRRYLGRWHEIGRYENSFERGCEGVTADYSLRNDGLVQVINSCRKGEGPVKVARGRAKVVEGSQGAKLKVSFFGPFFGDYWVLDHADDYSWSIVGEPSGRYLWLLSRLADPAPQVRQGIEARARSLGYDASLIRVTQP
ncbi:MAG: lipocalin family protein [Caulobacteraceae bacterium]|nr:lipocalin family protein [Caulobacteraceae bacterium]